MNEEAIVPAQPTQIVPLTAPEIVGRVRRILEVMESVMQNDVHYGKIPGCPKPSLWKPGAEKILATFRIGARPSDVEDLSTPDEKHYRVTVEGFNQATLVTADPGRVRLSAPIVERDSPSDVERAALAGMLARACGSFRMVRAALEPDPQRLAARLEVVGSLLRAAQGGRAYRDSA